MSNLLNDFNNKFLIDHLKIFESDCWIWSLRPNQTTLGAGILSLKRECNTFSELKLKEFSDLNIVINVIEGTLKRLFGYDIMNYLMLMMVDKHVHFHVIPRYEKEVELFGEIWKDTSWPGIPNLSGESLKIELLHNISSYIKDNLSS
jgi:diadenosine tetraphosphate (Ap4A) HIT family hydrolase